MSSLRTFIALELPEPARNYLARAQNDLQRMAREHNLSLGRALKWVEPEGIHITLKFLGQTDATLVDSLEEAIRQAGAGRPEANLQIAGFGAFPNPRQPRVLWVGLMGDTSGLQEIQRVIEAKVEALGFPPERRPFSPHLTLARVRETASPPERRAVADLLVRAPALPPLDFVADRLSLMKSQLQPTGARYEALYTLALG
ncbi:MAG: RNA 2',3'-cyclic phosphodiesterase [Chloroflexota bacterium]